MGHVQFDAELIRAYDTPGPRYTSYPTAPHFTEAFDEAAYRASALRSNSRGRLRDLSVYVHIPFCARLCYYCACNKIVTKRRTSADPYLERLEREIALQSSLYRDDRRVTQLHWGGGTPTFLRDDQIRRLMGALRRGFDFAPSAEGEYSIEIDPREVRAHTLEVLADLGFNRMSVGVQDFEPAVQRAVNRVQSESLTRGIIDHARELGFRSVSMDLIYGLPLQTLATFERTLEKVIAIAPERLSIYNYAHLPERFPAQARLRAEDLPDPSTKLDLLALAIERLSASGYAFIGMDHFARKDDALYRAQQEGTLQRNFQGYSTHAECDLIGLGVSAIGTVDGSYAQNHKALGAYEAALDAGRLPVARGLAPLPEDRLRRRVIMDLACHFRLRFADYPEVDFERHFARELEALAAMARDGLVALDAQGIQVTPRGRLLVRNVCMAFDRYLTQPEDRLRYSRVI